MVAVIIYYAVLSVITFTMFWADKRFAITGSSRIPEKTLLSFALVGGWPGALLGRHQFRHKTQKRMFSFLLYTGLVINLAFLYWLYQHTQFLEITG